MLAMRMIRVIVWYVYFQSSDTEHGFYQMVNNSWEVLHKTKHSFLSIYVIVSFLEDSAYLESCKRYLVFIRKIS